jgi:hypothetical protein
VIDWLRGLSVPQFLLVVVGTFAVLSIISALLTWVLVRRGLHTPWAIRRINRLSQWAVDLVKRPITIAVLDEVSQVLASGHYTKNVSDALVDNHDDLLAMVSEKVRNDPSSRVISHVPGFDSIVNQVSETTMRVLIEMLGDPRMDDLVSDLIRNNIEQIKEAVRVRRAEETASDVPKPAVSPMSGRPPV